MKIIVINGPNLNRLGKRDPSRYGHKSLNEVNAELQNLAAELSVNVECFQSNHEGLLVDWVHDRIDHVDGIIVNPASLTPYGRSLAQALADSGLPIVVVHISSVYKNAKPNRQDIYAESADAVITGLGTQGYQVALRHLVSLKNN